MFTVYKLICNATDMSYIGCTERPVKKRWWDHVSEAHRERGRGCESLHEAIREFGVDAFTVKPIGYAATRSAALALEAKCIVEHGTLEPDGYNRRVGSGHSEATRQRIAKAKTGKPNYARQKLLLDQIRWAKDAWLRGASILSLAGKLGVADSTLWRAFHGETYRHAQ